jgi:alkylation response protein AidB-like acyl-CoA dehydrogenase
MSTSLHPSFPPLFPGMLLDAAARFAQDNATTDLRASDTVRDMGWACTLVPEDAGGVGGSFADLAAVIEGLATHGVQLPVIETCAVAPILLQAAAPEVAARWLQAVAEGSAVVAPLAALSAPLCEVTLTAQPLDIGYALRGTLLGAELAPTATHAVLAARLGQGDDDIALFVLERERIPAPTATYRTMEGRQGLDLTLDGLAVPAAACLARGTAAQAALAQADNAALLLTAVDTVAALGAMLQRTVTHLQERRQFGVALASFQALRHRTADLYVRFLGARGLLMHAMALATDTATPPDVLGRTLRLAKLSMAETARACAEGAIQMHGGMGMSEEVLATRLAQRLIASEFRYGDRLLHARWLQQTPTPAQTPAQAGASPQSRSAR